jgi:hypothetical protein
MGCRRWDAGRHSMTCANDKRSFILRKALI